MYNGFNIVQPINLLEFTQYPVPIVSLTEFSIKVKKTKKQFWQIQQGLISELFSNVFAKQNI